MNAFADGARVEPGLGTPPHDAVPVKTDRGRAELGRRRGELRPRLRSLLLLADGQRSLANLGQMAAQIGGSPVDVDELLRGGFLALPVAPAPLPVPLPPTELPELVDVAEAVAIAAAVPVPNLAPPAAPVATPPAPPEPAVGMAPAAPCAPPPPPKAAPRARAQPRVQAQARPPVQPEAPAPASPADPLQDARQLLAEWLALDGSHAIRRALLARIEKAEGADALVALLEEAESRIRPPSRSHAGHLHVAQLHELLGLGNTRVADDAAAQAAADEAAAWASTLPGQ
jgi:hypothetical protein